ncbi:MAG: hypothetical protein IH587_15135, partial [Anaerolineae bacterium]|nr:hypothetical protein [Anaerolineae bacterium]
MSSPQGVTPTGLGPSSLSPGRSDRERLLYWGKRLAQWAPLLALLALCLLLSLLSPQFFSVRNFIGIANEAAPILVIAMGTTFVIILGSIDLSVEGIVAVSGVTVVLLARNDFNQNDYGWLSVVAAILLASGMGFLNGFIHTRLRIPSFMATLAMQYVGLGLATLLLAGNFAQMRDPQVRGLVLNRFPFFPDNPTLGLPHGTWLAIFAFLLAYVI